MLLLTSTADLVRVTTGAAVSTLEVHVSYVDISGDQVSPGRTNTLITAATTTTVCGAPAAGWQRNIKGLYITNNSAGSSTAVAVSHTDGTNSVELMQFILLAGENMTFDEEGRWSHRDSQGAEYPPAGLGVYAGTAYTFMKTGTAPDGVGFWYSTSKDAGFPGAWSPGTPGVNGRVTDGTLAADNGCVPIKSPTVGANFLTELLMTSSIAHTHLFYDLLWVNTGLGVTTTTAQAIAMGTLPARDINGTTNGGGCRIGMVFTTAATNAAVIANSTVTYTNSDGVANRTATLTAINGSQIPATPAIGTVVWFNLQAGDKGVRSIQALTLNTSLVAGAISMFIARDVATIGTVVANLPSFRDIADPGVRIYTGTCLLHCILASAATATFFSGELVIQEK